MKQRAVSVALGLAAMVAQADVRLAPIFGDHMVLQRGAPIRVWGQADPGEAVRVALAGRQGRAVADAAGRWQLDLPALPAGGPHRLTATARNTVVLDDVLMGDLWLCSGQSNMEWPLSETDDAPREIAAADHPRIRYRHVARRVALAPQADTETGAWQISQPSTAGRFSAVAYHFARRLQAGLHVPIGLIDASWGGSHVETWTSRAATLQSPDLAELVRTVPTDLAAYGAWTVERQRAAVQRWQGPLPLWTSDTPPDWAADGIDDQAWPELTAPQVWERQGLPSFDGTLWLRRRVELDAAQTQGAATLHLGMIDDCDQSFVNGQAVGATCGWDLKRAYALPAGLLRPGPNLIAVRVRDDGGDGGLHGDAAGLRLDTADGPVPLAGRWKARVERPLARTAPAFNDLPSLLFNGMVHPLTPLRLRGVIWYQGESNVPRAARYAQDFQRLIADWRQHWGQPSLPFLYVQLAAFQPGGEDPRVGSAWAELREAQRQALRLPHTGMAVGIDVGDARDIHPRRKRPVGERLALLALRRVHGQAMVDSGPEYRGQRVRPDGRIELRLHSPGSPPSVRGGGTVLQGFAVAGADQRFEPAQARLERGRVVVWSDAVSQPVAVRYAWTQHPAEADLVNRAGLPASPFRTDDWPLLTRDARAGF